MTDSTITISSTSSSTYRSQIHARLASPNSSSSSSSPSLGLSTALFRNRNLDQRPASQEKIQLRKLNDQFLSYIERVRLFETYNHCLTVHSEQIKTAQQRIQTKFDLLKQEFEEYQQERFDKEKKDIQVENQHSDQIERQVDEFKAKQKHFQHEHEQYRKHIIELQKKSIDVQAETEQVRFDFENLTDDTTHYRRQISYYQALKSSIVDEINRQRDLTQRYQLEVEDLKIQKQITIQAHEADTQAMQIHHDNVMYDLTANFRMDSHRKNGLKDMLNEIRDEYKQKDQQMRDEFHRKYLQTYNKHMRTHIDPKTNGSNREDFERRQLLSELNSLNDNRTILRQKLGLLREHAQQFESNIEREQKRKTEIERKYDDQINQLRSSIEDYESLIHDSSLIRSQTLRDEVDKYRQLLEGSDHLVGLRQLVGIPRSIEQNPTNTRPRTPPPPPTNPPITSEYFSLLTDHRLIQPSSTRQNSNSETSFETAPMSTNTTTQQYVSIQSISDPVLSTDNDTDHDRSQTIQCVSGRSSRIMSETDVVISEETMINEDALPPLPPKEYLNTTENSVEIPIVTSTNEEILVNQTLPFTPMIAPPQTTLDLISDGIQSPIISTLEQRENQQEISIEPQPILEPETIIPIAIEIEANLPEESKTSTKISSSVPIMPTIEEEKPYVPSTIDPIPDSKEPEANVVEIPLTSLPQTNPLAKLISNMLPNATPFVPNSTNNQNGPILSTPGMVNSMMNNEATPFIPNQHQNSMGSHYMPNNSSNPNHWGGRGGVGGGGNRRGQTGGGGYHHVGNGNQRTGMGGGHWQSGGGAHHKQQRRGPK